MKKRNEKTNTGEGGKVKRDRTDSDDVGMKSLSGTSNLVSPGVDNVWVRPSQVRNQL